MKHAFAWKPHEDEIIKALWDDHTSHEIAKRIPGRSHRAVIGRANRLCLKPKRRTPVRRDPGERTKKFVRPPDKSFQFLVRARHHESYSELWAREAKERARQAIEAALVIRNAPRTCEKCGNARQPGYLRCVEHLRRAA